MARPDANRLAAALPIFAIAAVALFVGGAVAISGETLGYDFRAYHAAAARVIDGQPLYDTSFEAAGPFGLFFYPPAFLPLILPFGLLPENVAIAIWIGLLGVAFAVGVAVLPVSRTIRWGIVLLAGLSWPFAYSIKLGQVGPVLFLLFALGWRWLDNPVRQGGGMALGTAAKIQPGILFVWAALTGRWRAVAIGVVILVVLSAIATTLAGLSAWTDFVTIMSRVLDPITTDRNLTPGAVVHRLGVPADVAAGIQLLSMGIVVVVVVFAALRATPEASYLVAVTASQLLSPILWDHYAMLLLLPVAYLASSGLRWAAAIPLATATLLVTVTPLAVYPLLFFVTLLATLAVGLRRAEPQPTVHASFA